MKSLSRMLAEFSLKPVCSTMFGKIQNQPSRGVLRKRCSENIQQIYRRTTMPKCAVQRYWNRTSTWLFSCKFAAYFRTLFPRNTSGWLLLLKNVQINGVHIPRKWIFSYTIYCTFTYTHPPSLVKTPPPSSIRKFKDDLDN